MKEGGENFYGFLMFYFPLTKIDDLFEKEKCILLEFTLLEFKVYL